MVCTKHSPPRPPPPKTLAECPFQSMQTSPRSRYSYIHRQRYARPVSFTFIETSNKIRRHSVARYTVVLLHHQKTELESAPSLIHRACYWCTPVISHPSSLLLMHSSKIERPKGKNGPSFSTKGTKGITGGRNNHAKHVLIWIQTKDHFASRRAFPTRNKRIFTTIKWMATNVRWSRACLPQHLMALFPTNEPTD